MIARLIPFGFVLLWSSSFVSAKIGLRHLSPLLFVAVRLAGCALVLTAAMLLLRRSWRALAAGRWLHCGIAGALMNAVGLMAPHVGLVSVPSAQIALVQSLTPPLTALFGAAILGERLRRIQSIGLLLGLVGVALVVGQAAFESTTRLEGLGLAFVGVIGLVAGTLYFGRFCRDVPLLPGATAQFVSAAVVAAAGTLLFETPHADWTEATLLAVAWNTLAVSLGGMVLYVIMLTRGSAASTTANFFLVPGTAAILAWLFLGEGLSLLAAVGLGVASVGCWLVNRTPGTAEIGATPTSANERTWRRR